jgi:hypothetical protein
MVDGTDTITVNTDLKLHKHVNNQSRDEIENSFITYDFYACRILFLHDQRYFLVSEMNKILYLAN